MNLFIETYKIQPDRIMSYMKVHMKQRGETEFLREENMSTLDCSITD